MKNIPLNIPPIVSEFIQTGILAAADVGKSIADQITNIRFGPIVDNKGTILFDYKNETRTIPEPSDVLLVDGGYAAKRWIAAKYLSTFIKG